MPTQHKNNVPEYVVSSDYPSESFRVLKNSEMNEFGENRTRRLVLDAFDRLARNLAGERKVG